MENLNWVDIVILAVFALSVLAGLMRGLVKEVLALVTWIVGFFLAVIFSPKLAAVFTQSASVQSMVSSASNSIGMDATQSVSAVSTGISFIVILVGVLIIGSLVTALISSAVNAGVGVMNRLLGGIFGLARGLLIVLVAIFLVQLTSFQQQPWWTQSQFVASFQPAVTWVGSIITPGFASLKTKVTDTIQHVNPEQLLQGQ